MRSGRGRGFRFPWRSRAKVAEELDEEIRFHLEQRTEDLVRDGMSPEEARERARREFGDVEGARAELLAGDLRREAGRRRSEWWDDTWRDVRFAARTLRRSPLWAAVAVLTLAIGIGTATAVFAALEAVVLRPFPVAEQDRLVVISTEHPARSDSHVPLPYLDVRAFAERTATLQAVAAVEYNRPAESILRIGEGALLSRGARVTGDFFPVLGVVPALGRTLHSADDLPGAEPAMVLGHAFWQRELGGDAAVLGSRVEWNGATHTVVGVAPPGFAYPGGAEFWTGVVAAVPGILEGSVPVERTPFFHVVGRLHDDRTAADAAAELATFLRDTDPARAEPLRGTRPVVNTLPELLVGEVRTPLLAVYGAGLLVLLLSCFNLAGLLLIEGTRRRRELGVRFALGAGRARVLRQLLTETSLVGLLGGILGCALAWAILKLLLAVAPSDFPRLESVGIGPAALAFAATATLVSVALAGIGPALASSSGRIWLRISGSASDLAHDSQWGRRAIVIGQTALAVLILAGAGLLHRSFQNLQALDVGYETRELAIAQLHLPAEKTGVRTNQLALMEAAIERLRALPGVESAALATAAPFSDTGGWDALVSGEGQSEESRASNPWLNFEVVTPEYFRTLQVPLSAGREFDHRDHAEAPSVAVISEAVAERLWPGENPLGKRVKIGEPDGPMPWHTVVGVVPEIRYREFVDPRPTLYLPVGQFGGPVPMRVALRTSGDPLQVLPSARAALHEVDPDLLIANVRTMSELVAAPLAAPRFSARLLGAFSAAGILMAAIGLFGVVGAYVRHRRAELGVRIALGARAADVVRLVARQGLGLAALGGLLGLLLALLAGRALSGLLFGVHPHDPLTLASVFLLLLAAAAAACLPPLRTALDVDPAETLRGG